MAVNTDPFITRKELKEQMPEMIADISIQTIPDHSALAAEGSESALLYSTAMKPLISAKMKKRWFAFARKYKVWIPEQWASIISLKRAPPEH
jgi:hypothetical protein